MEFSKYIIENKLKIQIETVNDKQLFKAKDVGVVFDITNINKKILKFDSTEKCELKLPTKGGLQTMFFLTEEGFLKVLKKIDTEAAKNIKKLVNKNNEIVEKHPLEIKCRSCRKLFISSFKNEDEKDIYKTCNLCRDKKKEFDKNKS